MPDPLAGISLPNMRDELSSLPRRGLKILDDNQRTLDDDMRMMEILVEELDYMSGEGKLIAIAERYRMDEGEIVRTNDSWRRYVETGAKFPFSGIHGKTTEVGFRAMVRASVIGASENLHHRKGNGHWVLDTYKVRKGYDGDTRVRVVSGTVQRVSGTGAGAGQHSMYGEVIMNEGVPKGTEYAPEGRVGVQFKHETSQRTVVFMDYTFVDIAGDKEIMFEEGRPAGEARRSAKETSDSMALVAAALQRLVGGAAAAPVAPPPPQHQTTDDMIEVLAKKFGIRTLDLKAALMTAKADQPVATDTEGPDVPATTTGTVEEAIWDGLVGHGKAVKEETGGWKWSCGVCGHRTMWHNLGIKQHMRAHVLSGEANQADMERELAFQKTTKVV